MVPDKAVEITIVVDIREVRRPGLLPESQAGGSSDFSIVPVAVILEKLVDPAGVIRARDPKPTL